MRVILFTDRTQFIILPTVGFIRQPDGLYLTVSVATVGFSVRLWSSPARPSGV